MGEHAEEALNDLLFGRWDDYEHDHGGLSSYGRDYPTPIRRQRCGSGPFDWKRFGPWSDPQWRLVDDDGNVHACPPTDPKKLFEDIS